MYLGFGSFAPSKLFAALSCRSISSSPDRRSALAKFAPSKLAPASQVFSNLAPLRFESFIVAALKSLDFWIDRSNVKIDLFVIRRSGAKDNERPLEKLSRYTEYVSRLVDLSRRTIDGKCRLISQRHFKKDRQTQFYNMLLSRNKGIGSIF